MRIYYLDFEKQIKLNLKKKSVLCLGFFDGVHLAHRDIILKAIEENKNVSLLTFSISPKSFLKHEDEKNIYTLDEKIYILKEIGIKKLFILNSTYELFNLKSEEFIKKILLPLNPKSLYFGFDFKFGKNNDGSVQNLKNYFNVNVIEEIKYKNEKISSKTIKKIITDGKIEEANLLLGDNFFLCGKVEQGLQNGRKIGYRTANIKPNKNKIIPKNGVYAGFLTYKGVNYKAMINVGVHPTVSPLSSPLIEIHAFNFHKNLCGKIIKVTFLFFVREEKKFDSLDMLKKQIEEDKKLILKQIN